MEFAELITIPKLDGVIVHVPLQTSIDGTLCLTGHQLIVSSRKENVPELWLLHQAIDSVEKRQWPHPSAGGTLIIRCKDFRIIQMEIEGSEALHNVYNSLERLTRSRRPESLYPFFYRPLFTPLENGHQLFGAESEFAKMRISDEWRITHVNRSFSVCPSYGAVLIVPRCVDDDLVLAAATFREGGRFPVLSYRHENGAALMRSGQPLVGQQKRRSRSDERLLNSALGGHRRGFIIDTRSAYLCKQRGINTEPDAHYPQWRRVHKTLDKVSRLDGGLLESLSRLVDACNDLACSADKWLSRLESSQWLSAVQSVLDAACLVAQCLDQEGAAVLVHGTGGLDATLAVTSIAQIILNSDCRTVRGFQALIEREWLQAGHPFQQRHMRGAYGSYANGNNGSGSISMTSSGSSGANNNNSGRYSQPTFLMFLDCVHQLHTQFDASFEFKKELLILLFEHSYASQYGTFLGNCEADRVHLQIRTRTTSLWSYLNRPETVQQLLNPLYEPNKAPIWASVHPVSLELWSDLYLRWVLTNREAERRWQRVDAIITKNKEMRSESARLRKEMLQLRKQCQRLNDKAAAMPKDDTIN